MTAWFMWQLQGDEEAAKAFVGENPEIMNNGLYQDQKINIDFCIFESAECLLVRFCSGLKKIFCVIAKRPKVSFFGIQLVLIDNAF